MFSKEAIMHIFFQAQKSHSFPRKSFRQLVNHETSGFTRNSQIYKHKILITFGICLSHVFLRLESRHTHTHTSLSFMKTISKVSYTPIIYLKLLALSSLCTNLTTVSGKHIHRFVVINQEYRQTKL